MRTHTRYELQDSGSMEGDPGGGGGPSTGASAAGGLGGGTDSPLPGPSGSVGSGASGVGTSRSVSSESADVPAAAVPSTAQQPPGVQVLLITRSFWGLLSYH